MSLNHTRTALSIVGVVTVAILVIAVGLNLPKSSAAPASAASATGVFNGQSYSGVLEGGNLFDNNSFPFQGYASTSQILALPAISSWLVANGYSPSDLRPYLSLYPSAGNPYDFSQGTVTQGGTTYNVYEYLVANSTVGLVIGAWVAPGSSPTVAKIFTYDTAGPDIMVMPATNQG